ncbi:hypothetical protein BASA61_009520 [Batrachochytrium salamandrivorans]|nr:hypothetical protein BASA62_005073 [Batrachochytrium salamandrivorans]KAH6580622.1 hypothetical protein BASA61_009520 [Batrachochytrium salamandrivorans]
MASQTPQQGGLLVIMGVSGSGKSTLAKAIVERGVLRNAVFVDADDLHSPESIDKMRQGQALTEKDRAPWLLAVSCRVALAIGDPSGDGDNQHGRWVVLACSCLKRQHRDFLRDSIAPVQMLLVYLECDQALILERVQHRKGHFAGASLVQSQFEALESPSPTIELGTLVMDGSLSVDHLCNELASHRVSFFSQL